MKNRYKKYRELKRTVTVICIVCISSLFIGCEDFVEIDTPKGELVSESIFSHEATTLSALIAIYQKMMGGIDPYTNGGVELYTGISSDELKYNDTDIAAIDIAENNISIENTLVFNIFWIKNYDKIAFANPIIENLRNNDVLPTAFRDQILGEALFLRAFFHFNLVNIFGDIPYANTSDVATLNTLSRMPVAEVYEHIIADLIEAKSLMVTDYSHAGDKKVRANKNAAIALLARTYLYTEDWSNAAVEASLIIQNGSYELDDVDKTFLAITKESILQIEMPAASQATWYANNFYSSAENPEISGNLLNAFEPGDARRASWVGLLDARYYPNKYKKLPSNSSTQNLPAEDFVLLRLAEQYLIRAEARAKQGDVSGAQADLNVIRNRAGLANTTAATAPDVLAAIAQERRIEFMIEGGHRWFDLKRTGKIDTVLGPLKADWQSTDALFPIPIQEILNNSNLTQNPGY